MLLKTIQQLQVEMMNLRDYNEILWLEKEMIMKSLSDRKN